MSKVELITAVSYTHLDVYKRQISCCFTIIFVDGFFKTWSIFCPFIVLIMAVYS